MKIIFTVCSMNYLGQAITLANSVKKNANSYQFFYGLADKVDGRDLRRISAEEVIEVEKIKIPNFGWMIKNYNIVEFATAVKPYYFEYLFNLFPQCTEIMYLDPDIKVFTDLREVSDLHTLHDVVLTPHYTKPIIDNKIPTEKKVFSTGIYNLGFVSMKRSDNTLALIEWWKRKLSYECINDLTRGYFVDQLWMVMAPVLFDKVYVSKHLGMNMAHWNLHERSLSTINGQYWVNEQFPLVFYHFSHFKPSQPNQLAAFHNRYTLDGRPDLAELYKIYTAELIENGFFIFIQAPCLYLNNEFQKAAKKYWGNVIRVLLPNGLKVKLGKWLA